MTQPTEFLSSDNPIDQQIYACAMSLFQERGYDQIQLEDIAAASNYPIETVHQYFTSKETIVMRLYAEHVTQLINFMDTQPSGQLTDRYNTVLTQMLTDLAPNRSALMALFGTAMRPESNLSLMGTDNNPVSHQLSEGYHQLILGSDDALREPKAQQLGIVLYTFHMLIILFWLYDRTPDQQATHKLRHFIYELFKLLRPMFMFPIIPKAIAKLSQIMMPQDDTR